MKYLTVLSNSNLLYLATVSNNSATTPLLFVCDQ